MQRITIPAKVERILEKLRKSGFEAYIVGGCVRDSLMGIIPKDYDITTSALPEETERVFADCKVIETGIKHGTITVVDGYGKYEITTYRVDGEYNDNRHPSSVSFTRSLREDLARRDFTVNAMAYSNENGLVDYFGGRNDLNVRVIKSVGKPEERFEEDGLRIMRALRFASCYSFKIENNTAKAVMNKRELLQNISAERIQDELNKLLCGESVVDVMTEYREVFAVIMPELSKCFDFEQHSKYHCYDIYTHILKSVEAADNELCIRLAMLLHDIGKPLCYTNTDGTGHFKGHAKQSVIIAEEILERLKYSGEIKNRVLMLIKYHDTVLTDDKKLVKKWLNTLGYEDFERMIKVHIADDKAKRPNVQNRIPIYKSTLETAQCVKEEASCFSLKQLNIKGGDIMSLGAEGKLIGFVLDELLAMVIEEKCENNKDILLQEAEKIIANKQ